MLHQKAAVIISDVESLAVPFRICAKLGTMMNTQVPRWFGFCGIKTIGVYRHEGLGLYANTNSAEEDHVE